MTWLVPFDTLAAYAGAAIVIVLVPGPAQALVIPRDSSGVAHLGRHSIGQA